MNASRMRSLLAVLLSGFALSAGAVPPDQPPLGLAIQTPNFDYYVRSGAQMPHWVPDSRLNQTGRALDRNGTPQNGNPLGYHPGYVNRGFRVPYFSKSGAYSVVWWACADNPGGFDCDNGFATLDQIIMPTDVYGNASESCVRGILGHELFHHIEFGYTNDGGGSGCGGTFGNAACEGQARALQDKVYFDLDLNPGASCVAPYLGQVDNYLGAPDRTIWTASYSAALFWTYLMEQYGEFAFEPARGIDFLVDWWDFAQSSVNDPDVYRITEDAIRVDHPTHSVLAAYHDFIIANVAKDLDLANESAAFVQRYSYRDEEPVPLMNNQMQYREVAMPADLVVPGGGSASTPLVAQRFGAEYRRFDVSACPAGRVLEFEVTPALPLAIGPNQQMVASDGMFALLPLRGGAHGNPAALYKHRSTAWKQTLIQPATPYSHVIAVAAGWHTAFDGTLSLRCRPPAPPATIVGLSNAHPLIAPPGAGAIGELTVAVDDPQTPLAPLDTLGTETVTVQIGLLLPAVQKVREAAARMRYFFPLPDLPLGNHDANVRVGALDTAFAGGVRVAPRRPEIMIALDNSASMGSTGGPSRLDAARAALRAMLVGVAPDARVGLLTFAGDSAAPGANVQLRVPLAPLDPTHRSALDLQLGAVLPSALLKIKLEDVLISSITQFDTQGSDGPRHLFLLTDSGDGDADAAALAAQAQAAGVRVHAIALDHRADQPLLARIAEESGGGFALSDADDPATAALAVPNLLASRRSANGASAVDEASGTVPGGGTLELGLEVDPDLDAAAISGHVKIFSGATNASFAAVRLYRPDGSQAVPGADVDLFTSANAFAFHVRNGASGEWRLQVDSGAAGGPAIEVDASAEVIDAARSLRIAFANPAGTPVPLDHFRVGDPILVQVAVLDFVGEPAPPAQANALIKHGTGTLSLALNDEGQHGDEQAGDQVYSGIFRATTAGSATGGDEDGSSSGSDGTYTVEATVGFLRGRALDPVLTQTRQVTIVQELVVPDTDADGLPDRYELRAFCLDAGADDDALDSDGDGAGNAAEFAAGSDPCAVDSDGGGETDGSELTRAASPLDPSDDAIRAIRQVEIVTERAEHEEDDVLPALSHTLRYGSDPDYAQLLVRRAPTPDGPFAAHVTLAGTAVDGEYVDSGLTAGQTWCYQLVPRSASGATGAASDTVCGVARSDNTAPRGSVVLDAGAPRTSTGLLTAKLSIDGEPSTGMQMNLRHPDGSESGWIPFASFAPVDASAIAAPARLTVAATFRDAAGNVSTDYADDIERVTAASVGRIVGTVRARLGGVAGPAIGGAILSLDALDAAGASSDGDGEFQLDALAPGTYALTVEAQGYEALLRTNIVLGAGATVDLGDLLLGVQPLFRDGFED
jgi:hypothetical protein